MQPDPETAFVAMATQIVAHCHPDFRSVYSGAAMRVLITRDYCVVMTAGRQPPKVLTKGLVTGVL